jgi:hypothetical protein
MVLYKKIKVPNFEVMAEEILSISQSQISQNLRFWDIPLPTFYEATPVFFNYLKNHFYRYPILLRFYNTPPFSKLGPHIDNIPTALNRIGFNFPLSGTKNTSMSYYDTPKDNLELSYTGFANMPTQLIKDNEKLSLVDSVEIDEPTLLRTDTIHGIDNPNATYRLILGMKFVGTTFEDVYKFDV